VENLEDADVMLIVADSGASIDIGMAKGILDYQHHPV
jgi:hypothetical protein